MSTTIRLSAETRDKVNQLTSKTNMSTDIVISFLIDLNERYNFFEDNWIAKLLETEIQEYLKDADIEFRKKIELQKNQAIIKAQMMIFKEWIDILEKPEKKLFLENVMGANKGTDFLEKLANYQMFVIDGQKKLYPPDQDGYPEIPFIPKGELLRCRRGFHIRNNRCDCRLWTECDWGAKQFEEWLSVHGTEQERKRYLEETTGQRYLVRR